MTSTKNSGWFTGRTRLITIVSIVAVSLAGATAVSANIGILNAASSSKAGTVSAAGDLTTPLASSGGTAGVQEFAVDVAGAVAVAATDGTLRLDNVSPTAGWTWSLAQNSQTELTVTMTNGARKLEFVATLTADGNIAAIVNEPTVAPAPPAANNGGEHEGGEHEGGGDDD